MSAVAIDPERRDQCMVVTGVTSPLGIELLRWGRERFRLRIGTHRRELTDRALPSMETDVQLICCDFGNPDSIDAAAEAITASTVHIDLLVHCMTMWRAGGLLEHDATAMRRDLDASVGGTVQFLRRILPRMIDGGGGHVVVIGSTAGTTRRWSLNTTYVVAKAALRTLGHALRKECLRSGVRTTVMNLGRIRSEDEANSGGMLLQDVIAAIECVTSLSGASLVEEVLMTPADMEY